MVNILHIVFNTILAMSVIGGILSILITLLRVITIRIFPLTWNYYVTVIAIIFFLVPVGLTTENIYHGVIKDFPIEPNVQFEISQGNLNLYKNGQLNLEHEAKQGSVIDVFYLFLPYISYVWLFGVGVFLVYKVLELLKFKKKLIRTSLLIEEGTMYEAVEEYRIRMGIRRSISLFSNDNINTPLLTGLLKPCLVIPEIEMDQRELKAIFHHELTHFKRKDLYVKAVALLANAIHWFNPLIYRTVSHMNELCELSCDEQVMKHMSIEERHFYGETILNILDRVVNKQTGIVLTLCDTKKGFKRRLLFIMKKRKFTKKALIISIGIGMVVLMTGTVIAHKITPSIEVLTSQATYNEQNSIDSSLVFDAREFEESKNLFPEDITISKDVNESENELDMDDFFAELAEKQEIFTDEKDIEKLTNPIPGRGRISSPYGSRVHPVTQETFLHQGVDFAAAEGSDIVATKDGKVIATNRELGGFASYGNYIILAHDDGTASLYAHANKLIAKTGDRVKRGEKIAEVGKTGYATGSHCHFEFRVNGKAVDPILYLVDSKNITS